MCKNILLLTLLLLPDMVFSQTSFRKEIIGFANLDDGIKIFIENREGGSQIKVDSTFMKNGTYRFVLKNKKIFYGSIRYENTGGYIPLICGNDRIVTIVDTTDKYVIKNSNINSVLETFITQLSDLIKKSNTAISNSLKNEKGDSLLAGNYYKQYEAYQILLKQEIVECLKKSKNSFVGIVLLYKYFSLFPKTELYKNLQIINPDFQKHPLYIELNNYAKSDLEYKTGSKVKDYCLIDNKKEKRCLYDVKSSYILLDFWATWCGPCLIVADSIDKFNFEFKGNGLKILRISLDNENSFEKWKSFIVKNDSSIINLIDFKGWNSNWIKEIGIKQIPFFILIDDKKRIIKKVESTDGVGELRKYFNQIFKK